LPPSPTDTRPTKRASRLFLLLLGCTLDLRRTSESLLSVLALLTCIHFVSTSPISRKAGAERTLLSGRLLNLACKSNTDQSVVGLKLLQRLGRIVDQRETSCLSTTILSLQTENVDLVLVGLVHFGELATEFILGDVGSVWVEDITVKEIIRILISNMNFESISIVEQTARLD
jgi:hypothetical protein